MTWFFVLPLSVLAGPAGLAVALVALYASRQKPALRPSNRSPEASEALIEQMLLTQKSRRPIADFRRLPFNAENVSALLDRCGL